MTLKNKLVDFLDTQKSLNEIYDNFSEESKTTIRGRLNENINKCFKRISRGVYVSTKGAAQAVIIEGDAWENIKEFEDNSFDTIITDSPYSCLNKHLSIGTTRKKDNKWSFETKDIDEELLKEMFRILKPGGHFFSFQPPDGKDSLSFNNNFIDMAMKNGFEFNKRWIWDKVYISMGYNGRNRHEQIFFLSKGKRHMPYDLSIPDVLSHKRIYHGHRLHEAEKPVELIKDILKFSTQKGEVVLDPFAGSLPLAKACLEMGINSINIELDKEMIEKSIQARNMQLC